MTIQKKRWKTLHEEDFKQIKAALDAGATVGFCVKFFDRGYNTIRNIAKADSLQEYRDSARTYFQAHHPQTVPQSKMTITASQQLSVDQKLDRVLELLIQLTQDKPRRGIFG